MTIVYIYDSCVQYVTIVYIYVTIFYYIYDTCIQYVTIVYMYVTMVYIYDNYLPI